MTLGHRLYREVRDFAPADLTHGELVVALMIADDANDGTRLSWIDQELLCARARMSDRGVRNCLQGLGARGLEFRVARGLDKTGRPVYAARGHSVDYLVPDFINGGTHVPPRPGDNRPDRRHGDAAFGPLKAARDGQKGGTRLQKGGTTVPPLSSDLLTISSYTALDLTAAVESARASPPGPVHNAPLNHPLGTRQGPS